MALQHSLGNIAHLKGILNDPTKNPMETAHGSVTATVQWLCVECIYFTWEELTALQKEQEQDID